MIDESLIAAEITITDRDIVLAFGGPEEEAQAMSIALAERLGVEPPPPDTLLFAEMTAAEMAPIVAWMIDAYPQIGSGVLPMPLAQATCEWRSFRLIADDEVEVDPAAVAAMIDEMHEEATKWGIDPDKSIGCVLQPRDPTQPILQVNVFPTMRAVYVEALPPDTELPATSPSPYSAKTHH
jgi:hypothetical protein